MNDVLTRPKVKKRGNKKLQLAAMAKRLAEKLKKKARESE